MIEEQARVVQVSGELAEIAAMRQPACGSCSAQRGCGTALLSSLFPQRALRFWVNNDIGAQPGDRVIVGLDERRLQQGSLLLYALPLMGLLLGAIAGEAGFPLVGLPAELGAVVSGLLGLIAALSIARRVASGGAEVGDAGVRLLRVAHRSPSIAPANIALTPARRVEGLRKF
jgi:sigma-E factor negative regulatory protein RseC